MDGCDDKLQIVVISGFEIQETWRKNFSCYKFFIQSEMNTFIIQRIRKSSTKELK